MAGITLEQAEEKLAGWLEAEEAVMTGQEYSKGNRRLVRANLGEIRESIRYWNDWVNRLARGGGVRITKGIPL